MCLNESFLSPSLAIFFKSLLKTLTIPSLHPVITSPSHPKTFQTVPGNCTTCLTYGEG